MIFSGVLLSSRNWRDTDQDNQRTRTHGGHTPSGCDSQSPQGCIIFVTVAFPNQTSGVKVFLFWPQCPY